MIMWTSRVFRSVFLCAGLSVMPTDNAIAGPAGLQNGSGFKASVPRDAAVSQAVSEASRRFGVPQAWIRAVMRVESGGMVRAVSSAGAIGLMQVMPRTYSELRWRYGLGADSFAVRDNVLAGTAYIRELADRYGAPAFLAAYNAGPARFEDALSGVRPLPSETIDYLSRLGSVVGWSAASSTQKQSAEVPRSPLEAPLFVALGANSTTAAMHSSGGLQLNRERQDKAGEDAINDGAKATSELARNELAPSSKGLNPLFSGHSGPAQ